MDHRLINTVPARPNHRFTALHAQQPSLPSKDK
jgi:hypothetical protein